MELGAGTGLQSSAALQTGALVVASDISAHSLGVLKRRYRDAKNLDTVVADMERLPFAARTFDAVLSAGSLSYGDPALVDGEIHRVLRRGGTLICVDSLSHNPVYRLNRWLQYLRGKRTRSTLVRMPNQERIRALGERFAEVHVEYFGALSFAMPGVALVAGEERARLALDWTDRIIGTTRSAFKFVIVARQFT